MILHGIYDNGKITIKEKNIPKIKKEVEIIFNDDKKIKNGLDFEKISAYGIWENKKNITDSTKFIRMLRKKIGRRYIDIS